MVLAARTSASMGWIGTRECGRIEALLTKAGLPTAATGVDADAVLDRMQLDKKADRKGVKLILIEQLGRAVISPAPERALLRAVIVAASR
jgi:3-dehydroquinate synthase